MGAGGPSEPGVLGRDRAWRQPPTSHPRPNPPQHPISLLPSVSLPPPVPQIPSEGARAVPGAQGAMLGGAHQRGHPAGLRAHEAAVRLRRHHALLLQQLRAGWVPCTPGRPLQGDGQRGPTAPSAHLAAGLEGSALGGSAARPAAVPGWEHPRWQGIGEHRWWRPGGSWGLLVVATGPLQPQGVPVGQRHGSPLRGGAVGRGQRVRSGAEQPGAPLTPKPIRVRTVWGRRSPKGLNPRAPTPGTPRTRCPTSPKTPSTYTGSPGSRLALRHNPPQAIPLTLNGASVRPQHLRGGGLEVGALLQ